MDYNSAVRLVLKLFGVVLIVYGAVTLASYLPSLLPLRDGDSYSQILPYAVPMLAPFIFGSLLWLFPATIANTVVPLEPSNKALRGEWAEQLERIGVSLLGLYLFYSAVSDILYHVIAYRAKAAALGSTRGPDDFAALITATIIEFLLALVLMLRSKGIATLLRKARGY